MLFQHWLSEESLQAKRGSWRRELESFTQILSRNDIQYMVDVCPFFGGYDHFEKTLILHFSFLSIPKSILNISDKILQTLCELVSEAHGLDSDTRYSVHVYVQHTQLRLRHSPVVHSLCVLPKVTVHQVRYRMDSEACSHVRPSKRHTLLQRNPAAI